ncbi:MAG: hypothetical protein IK070_01465 [Clostridia bacterium]|nr:hypothetical protein [Clostridia bacterium]
MKQNIIVLFGGVSTEHDISIITGVQTLNNIDEYLFNVIPVYITKKGVPITSKKFFDINTFRLNPTGKRVIFEGHSGCIKIGNIFAKKIHINCAVVCMHGKNGEDGLISGVLKFAGIPYTCGDMLPSAIACDKVIFKDVLHSMGVNYVPYVSVTCDEYNKSKSKCIKKILDSVSLPLIVKPANLGSSIGIEICKTRKNLSKCIENALKFDKKLLIEKYLSDFKELNIALYNDKKLHISHIEEPLKTSDILSFENKYIGKSKGMENLHRVRPKLDKATAMYLKDCSTKVYRHLGLNGVVRFDYIVADKVYLNEINTVPGSMANYLFDISFKDLITHLIHSAIEEYNIDKNFVSTFNSNVLKQSELNILKK